jgi:sugar/nucleoside kinase (ribokinase family)
MNSESNVPRRRNIGGLNSPAIPGDRYIVGGAFILRDEEGHHSVYFHPQPAMGAWPTSAMPDDETLADLVDVLAAAWDIANIPAEPAPND